MQVDEVAVPQHVARVLTFPDRVTPHNIERLRQAILNGALYLAGPDRHWAVLMPPEQLNTGTAL